MTNKSTINEILSVGVVFALILLFAYGLKLLADYISTLVYP